MDEVLQVHVSDVIWIVFQFAAYGFASCWLFHMAGWAASAKRVSSMMPDGLKG